MKEEINCFITELRKLKESSNEAVEGINKFSDFKKYMHVKSKVEEELIKKINKAVDFQGSRLILVCGSVGDGKSHIISYLREKHPDKLKVFDIHNDATESYDPNKDYKKVLSEKLYNFKDSNLNNGSNQKFILAINLGTLNNFIESEYKDEFKELNAFVYNKKILDTYYEKVDIDESMPFDFVNFSDYHMFDLTEAGVESEYIKNLFDKVADTSENNFFYSKCQKLCDNCRCKYKCPINYNYQLLLNEYTKNKVIGLLIEAMIKFKLIVSTRSLLNFIYDIIVPNKLDKLKNEQLIIDIDSLNYENYIKMLMPYMVFSHPDLSNIFLGISKLNPLNKRSEQIDNILVEINIKDNIDEVFINNIHIKENQYLLQSMKENLSGKLGLFSNVFVRFHRLLPNNGNINLEDNIFKKFIKDLYASNIKSRDMKNVYKEFEEALYKWNGKSEQNTVNIFIGNSQKKYIINQDLKIEPSIKINKQEWKCKIKRKFTPYIQIKYKSKDNDQEYTIDIDFLLYKLLHKVRLGYRPNKQDKNDFVSFVNFFNEILDCGTKKRKLNIIEKNDIKVNKYLLEKDNFGEYVFREL